MAKILSGSASMMRHDSIFSFLKKKAAYFRIPFLGFLLLLHSASTGTFDSLAGRKFVRDSDGHYVKFGYANAMLGLPGNSPFIATYWIEGGWIFFSKGVGEMTNLFMKWKFSFDGQALVIHDIWVDENAIECLSQQKKEAARRRPDTPDCR